MNKTMLSGALSLTLIQFAVASANDKASDLPISKEMANIEKKDETTIKNTNMMMAHLSFAAQAMDLQMKAAARKNLEEAKHLCELIDKSKSDSTSKHEYNYGKTTYDVAGVEKNYYLPVFDEVFIDGRFQEKSIWRKNPKVIEKNVALVHSSLQVNMNDVESSIATAQKFTSASQFESASKALDGIFKNAFSSEEVVTNPVWTVWGNLVLAQEFMKAGQFKNVRFALKSAKSDLGKLEKQNLLTKDGEEAKGLEAELQGIEKALDSRDPSMMKKIHTKLHTWALKVKSWV
jgi:hypothetical protein